MLMRFDPFREFDRITQALGQAPAGEPRPQAMAMDAYREGDRVLVMFDLPGVDPAGTEITVEKNVLTVRAERPAADTEGRTAGQVEAPAIPGQSETAKAAKEPAGAAGR